jgi:diguanylate cyclase (GGDEF)-like protein
VENQSVPQPRELSKITTRIALWVGGAMTSIAVMLSALVLWSTHEADRAAIARQQQLGTTVLAQNVAQVAHEQQAATAWDDSVLHMQRQVPDADWMEATWGVWFYAHYEHDLIFILDSRNRPVFMRKQGKRAPLRSFYSAERVVVPLAAQLRDRMRQRSADRHVPTTPGVTDLAVIDGHPAIVSLKPIVSDTGKIAQVPGTEFVHVSVRNLDGSFMKRLAEQYAIEGARFSNVPSRSASEASAPLTSASGKNIGYLVWKPFRPGSAILRIVGFALAIALMMIVVIVALLIRLIRASTLELQASRAHAERLALQDPLTGLANRALFDDRLDHNLASIRRGGSSTALLYLDLDRFKNINDTLGHPAGDELIRQLGMRLKHLVREDDTAARLGGDEFAIVQSGVTTAADTEILCMRIIEEVTRPFDLHGTSVRVGVSIGVATSADCGLDRVGLSRKADIALYAAKAAGGRRYMFFTPSMDEQVQSRQEIEADLRSALPSGEQLEVYYQPIYSAWTKQITGAEALVRWRHPAKGLMAPAEFIFIAEETGLIEELGEWVLEQACVAARRWELDTISVNVSPIQLRNPNFAAKVMSVVERTGLDPLKLELEITESCFIGGANEPETNLAALRAEGVRIALDDFGTGYSSFSHLRQFTVDRVKIDRSFVSGIGGAQGGSAIIRAIVDLTLASGIDVTAEGVETDEQSRFLSEVGCQSLQGFLMSRPLPAHEFGSLVESREDA